MRILNQIEKKELLQLNQKRIKEDIEASYGDRIARLNVSEEKKTNIKKKIQKIINISKRYISGIEQRILNPKYYQAQSSSELRKELIEDLGEGSFLKNNNIKISRYDDNKSHLEEYIDEIINSLLDSYNPHKKINSYTKYIQENTTRYNEELHEIINIGLYKRKSNKTKYPEIFKDGGNIWVEIEEIKASLDKATDMFEEIRNENISIDILEENNTAYINYKISMKEDGKDKSGKLALSTYINKLDELLIDLKHSLRENKEYKAEEFSKNNTRDIEIKFNDEELKKIFLSEEYLSTDILSKLSELKKYRGQNKIKENQKILNILSNNPLLYIHLAREMKIEGLNSESTGEEFKQIFSNSLNDIEGKYRSYIETIKKTIDIGQNLVDKKEISSIDTLVFSNTPWSVATQSTYQDWENCMHILGGNSKYIEDHIGYGAIACYGVNSKDPLHALVNYELLPYVNDKGKIIYRSPSYYGQFFDGLDDKVISIFNELTNTKVSTGLYNIASDELYDDGLSKIYIGNSTEDYIDAFKNRYINSIQQVPKELINEDLYLASIETNFNNFKYIPNEFKHNEKFCKKAFDLNIEIFKYIPNKYKTEEMSLKSIEENSYNFYYFPDDLTTKEIYEKAIDINPHVIYRIKDEYITEDLCLRAIKNKITSLSFLPKNLCNQEFYNKAFNINYDIFNFIPKEYKTKDMSLEAFNNNIDNFKYIPDKYKTEQMSLDAFNNNIDNFEYIPDKHKTIDICETAVKNDYRLLDNVPDTLKTENIILEAVKKNGVILENIADNLKTEEICKTAFINDIRAFKFIPDNFKTEEMCNIIFNEDKKQVVYIPSQYRTEEIWLEYFKHKLENGIKELPQNLKNEEFYLKIIAINGYFEKLKYIPQEDITEKIIIETVKQHYYNVSYLPDRFKTDKFYLKLVKINPCIIRYMPDHLKTKNLCLRAFKKDANMFEYIPNRFKDKYLCNKAVEVNNHLISFVPNIFKDKDILVKAFKNKAYDDEIPKQLKTELYNDLICKYNQPNLLKYLPDRFKTKELCLKAFNQDPFVLTCIPEKFITQEMCNIAFEKYGGNYQGLKLIPDKFKTEEMCNKAFEKSIFNIEYIPDRLKTKEMCERVFEEKYTFNENLKLLHYIPNEFKTKELCDYVFDNSPSLIGAIPEEYITQEMCDKTIKASYSNIKSIPDKFTKQEICDRAIDDDIRNIRYIPEKYITQVMCDKVLTEAPFRVDEIPEKYITQDFCNYAIQK